MNAITEFYGIAKFEVCFPNFFKGLSEGFFDGDDLARIGNNGIYGANAPNIMDQQTKV